MTAKIHISHDSKELLYDQAIISLLKLFEDGGQRAYAGVKCYSEERVCRLSTPSYSPDMKNIIFVYNLGKKKRLFINKSL